MNYRLLAIDLDGTLFDSHGKVPQANIDALRRAGDAGVLVTLCTGRGLTEAKSAIDALGHRGLLVLANGALIADAESGKTLERATIEPHLVVEVIDKLAEGDDAVLVLFDPAKVEHDYLVVRPERLTDNTKWWFDYCGATYRGVERATEDDVHHAVRVGIVGPASHMPPVQRRIEDAFGGELFVQHFMAVDATEPNGEPTHVFEVFAAGVNKWSALQWLAECHDIRPQQIAAIGDYVNDLEMISGAGCGVAMANATPDVAAIADRTTATNDEAGVARAVEMMLSGAW